MQNIMKLTPRKLYFQYISVFYGNIRQVHVKCRYLFEKIKSMTYICIDRKLQ